MSQDLSQLLPRILPVAKEAGDRILEIYSTNFDVTHKDDNTPLTTADMAAHKAIEAGLRKLTPEIPILSEESANIPFAERSQWQTYWLVDPLDGTREFVNRNGEFTVNIALIQDHNPVLGVIYTPVKDLYYYAAQGVGAFKQDGEQQAQVIRTRQKQQSPTLIAGSRSHRGDSLNAFLEKIGPHDMISMGSSLKSCLVAEGCVDIYPRLGPTSEWDTAAAQVVVEQAGGTIIEMDGKPLRYNTKDSLLNPFFLVIGDPEFDWLSYFS